MKLGRLLRLVSVLTAPLLLAAAVAAADNAAAPQPIDVYLIGGQSNATGQGYLKNLPPDFKIDTRVQLFNSGRPHLNSGAAPLTWVPLRQASETPDRFGPELGLGNRLQELFPAHRIALIKHAHSGTDLVRNWAPGEKADDRTGWGPQWITFVDTVDAGLKSLREQGYTPTLRGMVWQQGENDADKGGPAASEYGQNLAHFIARVREQFHAPDLLFVYGYVYPLPLPPPPKTVPGRDAVRQAEHDVDQNSSSPLAVKGAFVIATDDLSHRANDPGVAANLRNDHLHFGTAGMLELGQRMAEKLAHPGTAQPPTPGVTPTPPPAAGNSTATTGP